jgi:hypothetical protein
MREGVPDTIDPLSTPAETSQKPKWSNSRLSARTLPSYSRKRSRSTLSPSSFSTPSPVQAASTRFSSLVCLRKMERWRRRTRRCFAWGQRRVWWRCMRWSWLRNRWCRMRTPRRTRTTRPGRRPSRVARKWRGSQRSSGTRTGTSIVQRPSSNVHRPTSIVQRPSSNVHRPTSIVQRPTSDVQPRRPWRFIY